MGDKAGSKGRMGRGKGRMEGALGKRGRGRRDANRGGGGTGGGGKEGGIRYIDGKDGAAGAERALAAAGWIALDCEAAGFHRYSDRICLIQLSTEAETFVLDPLAFDPAPLLRAPLEDPERPILMHGAAYDLRLLARDLGIRVAALADTQVAAGFLGEPEVGLQALLERKLGIRVSKKFQRADWARRPLPRAMIDYAASDTRHLHALLADMEDELRARGRLHWAREECRILAESATDGADAPAPDPVTRIRRARHLDNRSLTALRAAIAWRDRVAREMDRAPFRVASDAALLGVVAARPGSLPALAAVPGFPKRMPRRRARALLDALAEVARLPAARLSSWPRPERRRPRPGPEEVAAFERLKAARNRAAGRLGMERGRVMANQLLQRVAAAAPATVEELAAIADVREWQLEAVGGELLGAVAGGS